MSVLNLENVPGKIVSGLGTEELEWITKESSERFILELDQGFLNEMNCEEDGEWGMLENDIIKEMDEAENSAIPMSTKFSTKQHVTKFKTFLSSKQLSTNIEEMPVSFLALYLRYFYFHLRCKDGRPYSPRSLIGIRAAIHRHLTSSDVNRCINIMKDSEFDRANKMLKTMIGKWLKEGSKSKQFCTIEKGDLKKIRVYFDRSTPEVLQQEIWFMLSFYFGFRGREVLSNLKMDHLSVGVDEDQRRYIFINHQYLSKNVKASLSQKEFLNLQNARMYDNPSDEKKCPVAAFELYKSKCPSNNENLFPMPKKIINKDCYWYCESRGLGKNTIGAMMKTISEKANLNKKYTNHCVRVSVVNELDSCGFTSEQICSVTGHKNRDSVEKYKRQKDTEKRKISDAITTSINDEIDDSVVPNKSFVLANVDNENINVALPAGGNVTFKFDGNFQNCNFHINLK